MKMQTPARRAAAWTVLAGSAALLAACNDDDSSGFTAPEALIPILDTWLTATFDGGRHARRVAQILEYERTHQHQ